MYNFFMTHSISKLGFFYDEKNVKTSSELVTMITSGLSHRATFKPTDPEIDFASHWLYRVSRDRRLYNFFPKNIRVAFPSLEILHEKSLEEINAYLRGVFSLEYSEDPSATNRMTRGDKLLLQNKALVGVALFDDAKLFEAGYTQSVRNGDENNEPLNVDEHMSVILTATLFIVKAHYVHLDAQTGNQVRESVPTNFRYCLPSVHQNVSGRSEARDMAFAFLSKQCQEVQAMMEETQRSGDSQSKQKSSKKLPKIVCITSD